MRLTNFIVGVSKKRKDKMNRFQSLMIGFRPISLPLFFDSKLLVVFIHFFKKRSSLHRC